jgi:DNA-binding LacI/PurR family transcriptional regulator
LISRAGVSKHVRVPRLSLHVGVMTHSEPDLSSPYFSACLSGLSAVFDSAHLFVNPKEQSMDGYILLAPDVSQIEEVRKAGGPVVVVNGVVEGIPSVDLDNVGASREMTGYLVGLGYRRIGFIAGKMETSNGKDRLEGYRQGLADRGIPWDPGLVVEGRFSREEGPKAMEHLLKVASQPTAVFAANDHMALGAWDFLIERKIKVPESIALAGFDDIPEAESRGLTSVRQPLKEMARHAGAWLKDWMQTGRRPTIEVQPFSGEPVFRGSSGFSVNKNPR